MFIKILFSDPLLFFALIFIISLSIVIHELAHGFAALSQGDQTPQELGHITLNPITHMGISGFICLVCFGITWGSMPVTPSNFRFGRMSSIFVSLAGPLSNLLLAIIFLSLIAWLPLQASSSLNLPPTFFIKLLQIASIMNLVLCIFNLLPIPPLDGFNALSELLPFLKKINSYPYLPLILLMVIFNIPGFWNWIYDLAGSLIQQILLALTQIKLKFL